MPADLTKLTVSLTKHGAHKIAFLLIRFETDKVLKNIDNNELDIHIDEAQARRILSCDSQGKVPRIWREIRKYGKQDIFDLVFLAIILSHHKLIEAMCQAIKKNCLLT